MKSMPKSKRCDLHIKELTLTEEEKKRCFKKYANAWSFSIWTITRNEDHRASAFKTFAHTL